MALFRSAALIAAAALFSGCSNQETLNETGTMLVTLPHGEKINAEVVTHPTEMMRGMMFRDSLAPDHGMLFIHGSPGQYTYYMYQVKIPLDIIWMDRERRIVEISADTPPCKAAKSAHEKIRECNLDKRQKANLKGQAIADIGSKARTKRSG